MDTIVAAYQKVYDEEAEELLKKATGSTSVRIVATDEYGEDLPSPKRLDGPQPSVERTMIYDGVGGTKMQTNMIVGPEAASNAAQTYDSACGLNPSDFARLTLLHEAAHAKKSLVLDEIMESKKKGTSVSRWAQENPEKTKMFHPDYLSFLIKNQSVRTTSQEAEQAQNKQEGFEEAYADSYAIQSANEFLGIDKKESARALLSYRKRLCETGASDAEHDTTTVLKMILENDQDPTSMPLKAVTPSSPAHESISVARLTQWRKNRNQGTLPEDNAPQPLAKQGMSH